MAAAQRLATVDGGIMGVGAGGSWDRQQSALKIDASGRPASGGIDASPAGSAGRRVRVVALLK